ncbi:RNA polymerase sigma factor [Hymenobacter antarcticus]|uniref:RNA polymerase sigma-70 region 2 domain-containing protein n=1 Tax=Hymenobacter antarcticus TaxID=486270 RepID=A0ABP7QYI6_9BACT
MLHVLPSNSGPPLTLPELLAACQRQERVAQRRLYGQFHGFAMGICQRYARDRDQALEAANDGFLKVFRDICRFDAARHPTDVLGSFRGWLKRIMIHTAIDHYRANERHQHHQEIDDTTLSYADTAATTVPASSIKLNYSEPHAVKLLAAPSGAPHSKTTEMAFAGPHREQAASQPEVTATPAPPAEASSAANEPIRIGRDDAGG